MKRLITFFLTLAITVGIFTPCIHAEDNDFSGNMSFLKAVDIVETEYRQSDSISNGEFINLVLNLMTDSKICGKELTDERRRLAVSFGMAEEFEVIDAEKNITYEKAVNMLANAIGYRVFKSSGSLMNKASEIGLLKNISESLSNALTAKTALQLLKNACGCKAVVANLPNYTDDMVINLQTDITVLEYSKNIYKKTGTVTGNEYSTLYIPEGVGEKKIAIDDNVYECADKAFAGYLGYEVVYYVQLDKKYEEDIVKYMYPSAKNDVTKIDAKDFEEITSDFRRINYENGKKSAHVNISAAPKVIFNGKACGDYTAEDFKIDAGSITVVKSRSADNTDVIIIESYEAFIADRISKENQKIYNKFEYTGASESISLEETDTEIISDGKNIDFTEIKEWDILSVAASRNGSKPRYKIYVSRNEELTKTEKISEAEKTVTAIGYVYNISDGYFKSRQENKLVGEELRAGQYQIYLLDIFENVVAVKKDYTKNKERYAYITRAYKDETEDIFSVKYFDVDDEEWYTGKLSEKVKVNGKVCKDVEDMYSSAVFDAEEKAVRQLVKLKFNASGEISKIETATEQAKANTSKFTKKQASTTTYWIENASFMYEIFPSDDAKILCVPQSDTDSDDYYVISRSELSSNMALLMAENVVAYDFDDFYRSSMIVLTYRFKTLDNLYQSENSLFVVESIETALGSDDEPHTQLVGYMGNYSDLVLITKDETVAQNIKPGDVIYIKLDEKGRLVQAMKACSTSDIKNSGDIYTSAKMMQYSGTSMNSKGQLVRGWIKDIDLNIGTNENMVMLDSAVMLPVKLNGSVTNVIIYDAKDRYAEIASIDDAEVGDLMVVRLQYSVVKSIVLIRNLTSR